ncbi:hypothetical protein C8Q74DRAFT_495377 [Fomes fomentarius]|nr:hypothetical protein C8Q74DRAFT_495377 [Fomes fomentarius]
MVHQRPTGYKNPLRPSKASAPRITTSSVALNCTPITVITLDSPITMRTIQSLVLLLAAAGSALAATGPLAHKRATDAALDNCNNHIGDCFSNGCAGQFTPRTPSERAPRARSTAARARSAVAVMATLEAARTMGVRASRGRAPKVSSKGEAAEGFTEGAEEQLDGIIGNLDNLLHDLEERASRGTGAEMGTKDEIEGSDAAQK